MSDRIRNAVEGDFESILALNEREVRQTSPMDLERLRHLHSMAALHWVAVAGDEVVAFLLAMAEGVPYRNDNYDWFSERYERFLYVDRVVVGPNHLRQGIGRQMYHDLFESARSMAVPFIVCEYNLEPPNPGSKAFHDRFGFREVGRQQVAGGTKLVSLQVAKVGR